MGKDGEETVEGSPSPKATDVTPETVAEVGVPTISAAEVPNGNEVGDDPEDIERGGPSSQIREDREMPLGETEPESEEPPPENNPDIEADAGTTGLERDIDYVGVPPIGISLVEADENEQRESAPNEMEAVPHEFPEEVDRMADVAREFTGPNDDKTAPDISELRFERGVDEEAAGMDAAPGDAQPENGEDTVGRDLDTHAASANIEPDGTPVETALETDEDLVGDQPEIDEAGLEIQPQADAVAGNFEIDAGMDKAPGDAEPEIDESFIVREVDVDTPSAIIEPAASDDALSETAAETDKDSPDVQLELEEVMEQSQPETDAVPSILDPEPNAESELEKKTTQVGEDASLGKEVEPEGPRIELQKDLSESEIDVNMDAASVEVEEAKPESTMREADSETEVNLGEIKPEVDATLDDITKDEVAEAESHPEERAILDHTNYNEGAQADIEPEPEESASIEVGPKVEVKNSYPSLETAADALKNIDPEPEKVTDKEIVRKFKPTNEVLTEITGSEEDLNQGEGTPLEADTQLAEGTTQELELEDEAEQADEALMKASEVSGSKEDFNQEVETRLEAVTEPEGTASMYEPEAEARTDVEAETEVLEPQSEVEVPFKSKLDQGGPIETDLDQSDLIQIERDQLKAEDSDQQIPQRKREADYGVETPELPGGEADQEEPSATNKPGLGDGSALPLLNGDALATSIPAIEQEKPEEGDVISPPEERVTDEGADEEQGAVLAQPDVSKEYSMEQERADVDDISGDQEAALSTEAHRSVVASEQEKDVEEPPAMTVDEEVSLRDEPHAADIEEAQPVLDDEQELTIDPSTTVVPPDESQMAEQGLRSTLPPESEVTASEYDLKDGLAAQNFDSSSGDAEREVGDEDAALSTVAEAGSVINDFDERASYQQLPVEFPSEQDPDTSESRVSDNTLSLQTPELQIDNSGREFVDTLSPRAPEFVGTRLTDQVGGGEHTDSSQEDGSKVSGDAPKDEVEWKAAQDFEPFDVHEEVSSIPDKEIIIVEAGGGEENGQGAVPPTFGIVPALDYLAATEEELMPKVLPSDTERLRSLPDYGVVNSEEAEIGTVEGRESKGAAATQGEVLESTFSSGDPLLSGSQEEDKQAFRQQNTQEASRPVILPPQDVKERALVLGNLKGDEHARGGGTLQRRTNWLGCCGMLDLLVGKNK